MKRNLTLLAASIIVLITASSITAAVTTYRQNLQIRSLEHLKGQRENDLHKTQGDLKNSQDQKQQIEQKAKDQEQQIQDLNNQLQAKKAQQESIAAATLRNVTGTARASAATPVVAGCGDNFYANYIYSHESGCNLNAVNPGGCRGIGQACPGSKLPCGADYACQNAFFTEYAMATYGSWEGAYSFWLSHHYW